jgi:hypothetical protein
MNFFFICFLALPLAITNYVAYGKNSQYSLPKEYRRFNIFDKYKYILFQGESHDFNSSKILELFAANLKAQERAKAERDEQERKNKIYRDHLASRDLSSFSKDFHTWRY